VASSDGELNVLGFAGSLRRASYNRGLLRAARDVAPPGMAIDVIELGDIPLFDQDLEARGDPPPVADFKARIRAADALLIATPEHSNSIPGVLKNALDWAARPTGASALEQKPVAIMGATPGPFGTTMAQYELRAVFVFSNAYVMLRPQLRVRGAEDLFDDDGDLLDERTRGRVRELLEALAAWAGRFEA
jgi:chromate reductase, NAD(P)H dehydrogenase (quinone)